jgi:hypothetical protein
MQLTMTIRRSLTPTTFSYPCSRDNSTNEHSISRVSRSEGEGNFWEWVRGLGGCKFHEIALWLHSGTLLVSGIFLAVNNRLFNLKQASIQKSIKVSLNAVNNIIVVTYFSEWHRLSLSLVAAHGITSKFSCYTLRVLIPD